MNHRDCEHTETILALGGGAPPPEVERHARSCAACADALLVARFLAHEAEAVQAAAPVPDASLVWDRAQTRIRAEAVARATRPIAIVRRIAWACGGLVGAGALVRFHTAIGDSATRVGSAMGDLHWGDPAALASSGPALVTAAGTLALATLFFGLYTTWAEEA